MTSFDSNGFSVGSNGGVNGGSGSYVAWNWNAGDAASKTYRVVVSSAGGSGNKYRFRNSANSATFAADAVTLDLEEGGTYIFNMDDSTNASHPFSIGTAANGTVYTSGITYFLDGVSKTYDQYTSGFASASTRRLHITVPASAPVLYYWCSVHNGMGGQINTNSTLGSSNFDGSNQTVVKANTTAGFSIISYTGTGSTNTIGHGLGVTPKIYIIKNRDAGDNWIYYTTAIDGSLDFIYFTTGTKSNSINTAPTSTVIEISGQTTNDNGDKHICYAFNEVAGFSKTGTYTGNGSTDGPFVYVGFRPAFVLTKITDTMNENWTISDSKRSTFNAVDLFLRPDESTSDTSGAATMDFLSNGFKLKNTDDKTNRSGAKFIFLAFAESPFKNSRAR